eukprot:758818-Hanusia_phi.AAC.1
MLPAGCCLRKRSMPLMSYRIPAEKLRLYSEAMSSYARDLLPLLQFLSITSCSITLVSTSSHATVNLAVHLLVPSPLPRADDLPSSECCAHHDASSLQFPPPPPSPSPPPASPRSLREGGAPAACRACSCSA